ncbi:hypothetical protein HPULCUR_006602 [Helicostylum pulchrum]|uniref:Uncharacterized protein n=1 Tax=Helicostylum pulchrum TaxID=562976 RepID=A0ABP9Y399_9FUNG
MHNLVKQKEQQLTLNQSWKAYGEESLEITPIDEDEILDQSDLAQRIMDAEKKFSTSSITTSLFDSQYFEHPALYRVLFMGSITDEKKKELFKKLSQGFAHVSQQQTRPDCKNLSLLGQPILPFKEIKHNIVLLSDDDDPNLISDSFEDIGVSMIEADFTWNSNAVNYSNDPTNLLLQYAWNQCPNPRDLPSAWIENKISKTKFIGYMFPETTPNGIDLCVYFYDGSKNEERTKKDLELLCLLRKLGIYVLPLTTTRDESMKGHFADLLTQYKVRCLDLGNLEVGQEPSFFHHKHKQSTADRLSRLQGMECTQSNVPRVATYQILTVDQFCGIENKAIFELLKRTRERQILRDELKQEFVQKVSSSEESIQSNTTDKVIPLQKTKSYINPFIQGALFSFIAMVGLNWLNNYYVELQVPAKWTASFDINSTLAFSLTVKDPTQRFDWPNPDPQVWLNHEQPIPIVKDTELGKYNLLLDPLLNTQKFTSVVLSINHTNIDFYNTETRSTYLFYSTNKDDTSSTVLVKEDNSNVLKNVTLEQEDRMDTGIIQKTWKGLVFIKDNIFNVKKIILRN